MREEISNLDEAFYSSKGALCGIGKHKEGLPHGLKKNQRRRPEPNKASLVLKQISTQKPAVLYQVHMVTSIKHV